MCLVPNLAMRPVQPSEVRSLARRIRQLEAKHDVSARWRERIKEQTKTVKEDLSAANVRINRLGTRISGLEVKTRNLAYQEELDPIRAKGSELEAVIIQTKAELESAKARLRNLEDQVNL